MASSTIRFPLLAIQAFSSAFLLFVIQPIAGEILTPVVGGGSLAWITCLLFFQVALFAGYSLAWFLIARFPQRVMGIQAVLYFVGLIAWVFRPEASLDPSSWDPAFPIQFRILGYLSLQFLLPVLSLATTSTITQHEAGTVVGSRASQLYAWSNAGSFLGLLAFPFALEPWTTRIQQLQIFPLGLAWLGLLSLCGAGLRGNAPLAFPTPPTRETRGHSGGISWQWLLIPFLTSALLCGVTGHLSSELASVPFLWVVPLGLFLVSFVIAFSQGFSLAISLCNRVLPMSLTLAFFFLGVSGLELAAGTVAIPLVVHLLAFFCLILRLNVLLHESKPAPDQLARYYFFLALGGLLGTAFQSLLTPILFRQIGYAEYPLSLFAGTLVLGWAARPRFPQVGELGVLTLILVVSLAGIIGLRFLDPVWQGKAHALVVGVALVASYTLSGRLLWFSVGSGAALLGAWVSLLGSQNIVATIRNEYGTIRIAVVRDEGGERRVLYHGGTIHGIQSESMKDAGGRHLPLSYYGNQGPVGSLIRKMSQGKRPPLKAGLIGLGVGSIAWYAPEGADWTYFELDPAVAWAAQDSGYFSFLEEARSRPRVVLGDGRFQLAASPGNLDLLILDAFSSDTIPIHLLTIEALDLYLAKLGEGGTLLCHISNRHFDLLPVMAGWQKQRRVRVQYFDDSSIHPASISEGYSPSQWVAITKEPSLVEALRKDYRWSDLPTGIPPVIWTDDHHSVLWVLKW